MRLPGLARLLILALILAVIIGKVYVVYRSIDPNLFLIIYGLTVSFVLTVTFIVTYFFYKDPYLVAAKNPEARAKTPLVTCLIAVWNEEKIIEQCINSMLNQSYENKEIIFINDNSTDGTRQILDRYARQGLIRVIHMDTNVGKKRALGRGMLEAKGEIFAFSDSDSVWAPDALEKIVLIFNHDPLVGAVSGHCRALNAETNLVTKVQDSWYEGQFSVRKAFESVYGAVTCVSGPLAVFHRAAIYNYIPAWENDTFLGQEFKFATDRTLTGFVLGSRAIGKKLKEKYADSPFVTSENHEPREWKVVYCKAARAWTEVPDNFKRMLKQQIRWKKSFIRNMFFTGSFYWRKPFIPSLAYYMHILFVLVGPFISFRHMVLLPIQGDLLSAVLYISGIIFVGLTFAMAYKIENRHCHRWVYRPLMSLTSTLVLSWLVFYSAATIKKMVWARG